MPSRKKINTKPRGRGLHVDGNDLKQVLDGIFKNDREAFNWFDDWEDEPVSSTPSSVVTPATPSTPATAAATAKRNKFKPLIQQSIDEVISLLQADYDTCIQVNASGAVPNATQFQAVEDTITYVESRPVTVDTTAIAQTFIDEVSDKLKTNFINIRIATYNSSATNQIATTKTTIDTDVLTLIKTQLTLANVKAIFDLFVTEALTKRTATLASIEDEYKTVTYKLVDELKTYIKTQLSISFLNGLVSLYDTTVYPDGRKMTLRSKKPKKITKKNLKNKPVSPKNFNKQSNKILASLRPC